MTAGHLTREECTEAGGQAQRIQKAINTAIGRQFARCSAPMRFRPRDVSSPDQDLRYGLELWVEPLVTIADFREQPGRRIAATLREWAAFLEQAAATLER
jgi:hypothetical protein